MASTLKELVHQPDTVLVDVRSPWEFETEHISGALNIPLEEIPGRLQEFRQHKGAFVLYCRSGNRSGMALQYLKQLGITQVYNGGSLYEVKHLLN